MLLLKDIQQNIDKHQIISFDIFDTLLIRPYIRPTDVFRHMEKSYGKPFFADARIAAEQAARKHHPHLEDITFDMIYDEMEDEYKEMKQKEMDWEEMVLRPNPELKPVYSYAKAQGKKIIIASDMYLPTEFIAEVLRKNGYDGWDGLYVSGDMNKSKYKGTLFTRIMEQQGCGAGDILHIGDNKKSDYEIPRRMNMSAYLYVPAQHKRFAAYKKQFRQVGSCDNLNWKISAILSLWAEKETSAEDLGYWHNLGYKYAGAAAYGYMQFVNATAQNQKLDSLLFVARDGWLLQKVFKMINPARAAKYVYAPRILNNLYRLDYVHIKKEESKAIIEYYAQTSAELARRAASARLNTAGECHEFVRANSDIIKPLAEEKLKQYRTYLTKDLKNVTNIGLVDTITGAFSSQKLIEAALKQYVCGIYWGVCMPAFLPVFKHKAYAGEIGSNTELRNDIFTKCWNFMEFLLTSPEHPVIGITDSGAPQYAPEQNICEIKRSEIYKEIAAGALQFAEDVQNRFSGHDIFIEAADIVRLVNGFINHPQKEDIRHFADIKISEDSTHRMWIPLFSTQITLKEFVQKPFQSLKKLQKLVWRSKIQTILLNISRPFSAHIRGIKKIEITFFPYFQKQYFSIAFTPAEKWQYKLIIGNKKG